MENLRLEKTTKAPGRLAIIQNILEIIAEHDEMCKLMVYRAEKNRNAEIISITAKFISRIHNETEKKLGELETVAMKFHHKQLMENDGMEIFRTWGAYFMKKTEYITFKEMGRMEAKDLMEIMKFYVELIKDALNSHIFHGPVSLEDQDEHITLITKYRIMLKHINRMNMEGCLELQKKFSKDHIPGDHYHVKKQEPEKVTNLDMSSFEKKSKKESSDLITLATEKSKD